MKKIINTKSAPAPIGPYNQAVLSENTLYISGQIPMDSITGEMISGDIKKETAQCMQNLKVILEEAGIAVTSRLEFGSPRQMICKIANDEKFQLMVIGRRESTGEIRDVLFGSVANYVLHNVACPVLLF